MSTYFRIRHFFTKSSQSSQSSHILEYALRGVPLALRAFQRLRRIPLSSQKKTATRKDSGLIMYQPVGLFEGEDEAADHVAINKELGSVHSFMQDFFYRPIEGAADGLSCILKVALERIRLPTAFKSEGMVF